MNATLKPDLTLLYCDSSDDVGKSVILLAYSLLIFCLGVPGNLLILGVYWGKMNKSTTDILIQGLALVDFVVCLLRLVSVGFYSMCLVHVIVPRFWQDTFVFLNRVWVGMSVLVTAMIAFDRYDCVCRPRCRIMTTKRTKKALACVFALTICGHSPLYIIENVRDDKSDLESVSMVLYIMRGITFVTALLMVSVCYSKVYLTIRSHVRIGSVSISDNSASTQQQFPTVVTVSALGMQKQATVSKLPLQNTARERVAKHESSAGAYNRSTIRKSTPSRDDKGVQLQEIGSGNQQSVLAATVSGGAPVLRPNPFQRPCFIRRKSSSSVLQRRTTTILFVTSLVFLMSWLPYWVVAVMRFFDVNYPDAAEVATDIFYLNNVVNPFIYGVANRRFRHECRDVFRRMRQCWRHA